METWRRAPGRPRTTWMKTIQQDLKPNNLSLYETIDMAHNRPSGDWCLCLALCTFTGACLKRRRRKRARNGVLAFAVYQNQWKWLKILGTDEHPVRFFVALRYDVSNWCEPTCFVLFADTGWSVPLFHLYGEAERRTSLPSLFKTVLLHLHSRMILLFISAVLLGQLVDS